MMCVRRIEGNQAPGGRGLACKLFYLPIIYRRTQSHSVDGHLPAESKLRKYVED
jgi:hypothetical protein